MGRLKLAKKENRYDNDFLSVTEVLSNIRKIGLEMWFKMHTKEECDRLSEAAKEIGTQVHFLIQHFISGATTVAKAEYPVEVANAIKSFLLFKADHPELELKIVERKVTSSALELNGTIDCIAETDEGLAILDWKTGECKNKDVPEIYFEYLLQVAAYWLLAAREDVKWEKLPDIKGAMVVVFAKDKIAYNIQKIPNHLITKFADVFYNILQYAIAKRNLEREVIEERKKEKLLKN
jgi:hypothetical protein